MYSTAVSLLNMDYNTAKDSITIHYYLNSNSILLNIHSGMIQR